MIANTFVLKHIYRAMQPAAKMQDQYAHSLQAEPEN